MTTGASWPWNLSTVPTRAPSGSAALISRDLGVVRRHDQHVRRPDRRLRPLVVPPRRALHRVPQPRDDVGLLLALVRARPLVSHRQHPQPAARQRPLPQHRHPLAAVADRSRPSYASSDTNAVRSGASGTTGRGRRRGRPGSSGARRAGAPAPRRPDSPGCTAWRRLRQLLRVAQQHHRPRAPRHRHRVRQRELPRLVDHQHVDGLGHVRAGPEPRRPADQVHVAVHQRPRDEAVVRRPRHVVRTAVLALVALLQRRPPDRLQQVADDRVGGRRDADLLARRPAAPGSARPPRSSCRSPAGPGWPAPRRPAPGRAARSRRSSTRPRAAAFPRERAARPAPAPGSRGRPARPRRSPRSPRAGSWCSAARPARARAAAAARPPSSSAPAARPWRRARRPSPAFFAVSTSSASSPADTFVSCTGNEYSYRWLRFSGPRYRLEGQPAQRRAVLAQLLAVQVLQPEDLPPGRRSSRRCQPTRSPSSSCPASCSRSASSCSAACASVTFGSGLGGHPRRPRQRPVQRLQLGALLLQPVVQLAGGVDVVLVVRLDRGQLRRRRRRPATARTSSTLPSALATSPPCDRP